MRQGKEAKLRHEAQQHSSSGLYTLSHPTCQRWQRAVFSRDFGIIACTAFAAFIALLRSASSDPRFWRPLRNPILFLCNPA